MFDLTTSLERDIEAWRDGLDATGSFTTGDLDELESHLRDEIEALGEVGITGADAFSFARDRLGDTAALGSEFARANPAVVWRAPLLWIATGCFATCVALPWFERAREIGELAGSVLHLPHVTAGVVLASAWVAPSLVFYAALIVWARRQERVPFAWAAVSSARVTVLVAGALAAVLGYMVRYPLVTLIWNLRPIEDYFGSGGLALCAAAPVTLAATVVVSRARMRPALWVALGSLAMMALYRVEAVVFHATLLAGSAARLAMPQMRRVMWVASLLTPALPFLAAYACRRYRLPSPREVVHGGAFVVATLVLPVVTVLGPAFGTLLSTGAHTLNEKEIFIDAIVTWQLAGVVETCALPVVLGAILLRLRGSLKGGLRAR